MRKVTSGLFISLDGVVEAPYEWQFDLFDQDMDRVMQQWMDGTDTALMGRVTYEDWAGYWASSTDEPFAGWINNIPKYVASTTLQDVSWQNSTLIRGPLADEIARLKQQPGKDISVCGSPTLVRWLLENDLLDELTLMIHPVVVGHGKRLFYDGGGLKRMALVDSTISGSGVANLVYQPAKTA